MKFSTSDARPAVVAADLLAIATDIAAVTDDPALDELDAALAGALRQAAANERFKGKAGQVLVLNTLGRLPSRRLALIGLGDRATVTPNSLRAFAGQAAKLANAGSAKTLVLATLSPPTQSDAPHAARALAEGAQLGSYRFDRYLAEERRTPISLQAVTLLLGAVDLATTLRSAEITATAIACARDLVNEPAAVATPTHLAEVAHDIARDGGMEIQVLDRDACTRHGMGLFLAVARGSAEPPRFIHLAWKPANAKKRVVLVGKGVTFDSGGLSLKPSDSMLDMKTDMAGAAAVLSAMAAIAAEKLPIEVHALAACTENMPSGSAYRLGDVIRSKAGKTVEINNTDAEGRLTLADALAYGLELKPDQIFDFATLTGACMVALGPDIAGVMSNNESLARDFLQAAEVAGESAWRLPLPDRLLEQLKSDVADFRNTGERMGGALTAGLFLREFVGETPWVHVDLAGPSTSSKDHGHISKGGTGFGVATILTHLRRLAAA